MADIIQHETCKSNAHLFHEKMIAAPGIATKNNAMNRKTEIGRRIKQARTAKGWTLEDLCGRLPGINPSALGNYESGLREADIDRYIKIAAALDVSAAWLLTLDDEAAVTPEELKLLHAYRLTDDRGRTQLATIADTQPTYEPGQDQSQGQDQTII
jgi:transcriptional regulator with XRE-family HTH domain